MRMIRTDDWKLVWHFDADGNALPDASHELFDLKNDPGELKNLYAGPPDAKVKQQLEVLVRWED